MHGSLVRAACQSEGLCCVAPTRTPGGAKYQAGGKASLVLGSVPQGCFPHDDVCTCCCSCMLGARRHHFLHENLKAAGETLALGSTISIVGKSVPAGGRGHVIVRRQLQS